jgi:glycerol-3-phosphate dehydrogenase
LRGQALRSFDLVVIGGGINGVGVARDAAGRGLSVLLAEKGDLAGATSSASSKLIHGGLRYLERYEFRLVAEALAEREVLLRTAGHLVWSTRFVMPHVPELRPRWMIRLGLLFYDHLGRATSLAGSRGVRLDASPYGDGLKPGLKHGFVYSDCRVDDARLVIGVARAAHALGAEILTRSELISAHREGGAWRVRLRDRDGERELSARALVNAAGPWVERVLNDRLAQSSVEQLRRVKGSHIVLPRLYRGEHAFILQNVDRRVVFMIPYEGRFTLVGTTDMAYEGDPSQASASDAEIEYLCAAVNRYLATPVSPKQVVWSYAGVRALYDDRRTALSAVTRDYMLRVDDVAGSAPVLSVYGGKLTTHRRLAERVLERLASYFPTLKESGTAGAVLPGGDFGEYAREEFEARFAARYRALPEAVVKGIFRRHGALAAEVLGDSRGAADLGEDFGAGLCEREVRYLVEHEWAASAEDVLWRRTKCGLHLDERARARVADFLGA